MRKDMRKVNFENAIQKEWIMTNGLGGFASSTIVGANTRKYHGLLIAPLSAPANRYLILSKIDESIDINGKNHILYTNMCRDNISLGYKYLTQFSKEEIPVFTYEIDGVCVEKSICMEHGKNVVVVLYHVKNGESKSLLKLTPLLNYRNFHSASLDRVYKVKQEVSKNFVDVTIDKEPHHIYMNCSDGRYVKTPNDSFKDMYYIEEEKRGLSDQENQAIAGRYEIKLKPNEEKYITFVCSLDDKRIKTKDAQKVIQGEKERIDKLVKQAGFKENDELAITYIIAADNFIVKRKKLHTMIAGYPWFLDWGRDTCIAFEGIALKNKRFDVAKDLLKTLTKDIKCGLVPNGYSEYDNTPLYNSVDSSLLLFNQVKKYINYTGDYDFIRDEIYDKLKNIINEYRSGIDLDDNNIYMDEDYLISAGTLSTQNTWMDAKIGNFVVTPRNGKQVEINALWYNALMVVAELGKKFGDDKALVSEYKKMAKNVKKSFNEKFYNKDTKCLYDVLGDDSIRPNQLFALSLEYPVLDLSTDVAKTVFHTCTKKLLNLHGLKTLAKEDSRYIGVYEGNQYRRDISYHQGITWPWLIGLYNDAYVNLIKAEKNKENKKKLKANYKLFVQDLKKTYIKEMNDGKTIGSIPELYDSKRPYEAKGAFAQSWSVSEVFRIIL